ncbi:hypothetical protein ANO14919_035500 [Xylariales sp. No.14919]|nr:hypothetical protein ANO14919_035500 [Xylariales sp. No.14919]
MVEWVLTGLSVEASSPFPDGFSKGDFEKARRMIPFQSVITAFSRQGRML